MSLETTYSDVTAEEFLIDVDPTVASENYFAILGVDSTTSGNLTTGGSAASNIGTGPTYNADHIVCDPTNALQMPIGMAATGYTVIIAFKLISGGVGAATRLLWTQPNLTLFALSLTSAGLLTFTATGVGGAAATLQIAGSLDRWICVACCGGGAGVTKIYNLTDATESSDGGGPGDITTNGAVYISLSGGHTPGSNTLQARFAAAVKTQARISKPEIDAYYAFVQGLLSADRDITI